MTLGCERFTSLVEHGHFIGLLSALGLSCAPSSAPRASEPAPARVAASPCGAAIELTKSLRSEGRLDRAARTLERVIPSCNGSEQSVARALQREVLVELGPGPVSKAQQAEPLAPLREPDAAMVKGDAQAALAAYESAWKKQQWHAQALIGAGFAARMLGNERLARAHFDRALTALEAPNGARARATQLRNPFGSPPVVSFSAPNEFTGASILMRRHGQRWLPMQMLPGGVHGWSRGLQAAPAGDRLRLVDRDGVEVITLDGYTNFVVASDDQRLAAWSDSRQALYDLRTGKVIAERAGKGSLAFGGADDKWLLDTDGGDTIVLDGRSLAERVRIRATELIFLDSLERVVALVRDAEGLSFALELWDLGKRERIKRFAARAQGDGMFTHTLDEENKRFLWWGRELGSLDLASANIAILGPAPHNGGDGGIAVEDGGRRLCLGSTLQGFRILPSKPRPGFRQRCYRNYHTRGLTIAELPEPAKGRAHVDRAQMLTGSFLMEDYEVLSPGSDLVARLEQSSAKERYFVAIYSVSTGKLVRLLDVAPAGSAAAPVLRFSADGTHVRARGSQGSLVAWDIRTGASKSVEEEDDPPERSELPAQPAKPEGRLQFRGMSFIWSGKAGWSWWDLARGVRIHGERRGYDAVLLSPGGRRVGLVERKRRPPDHRAASLTVVDDTGKSSPPLAASVDGLEFRLSDVGRVAWWGTGGNWVADLAAHGWRKRQIDSKGYPVFISADGKWLALEGQHYVVESTDTGEVVPSGPAYNDYEVFVRDSDKTRSTDGKWSFEMELGRTAAAIRLTATGEVRATVLPTGPESVVVLLDGGAVERLGPAGPAENLACVIGSGIAPFEVCEERLLVRGALPKLETKTYLDP